MSIGRTEATLVYGRRFDTFVN